MKDIQEQKQIDSLRRRLYERGKDVPASDRHDLSQTKKTVTNDWSAPVARPPTPAATEPAARQKSMQDPDVEVATVTAEDITSPKKSLSYRTIIILASMIAFVTVVVATSIYLFLGGNQFSSAQITVNVSGPLTISGGEVLALEAVVENNNNAPLESAVLIVQYPAGTRSTDAGQRNLFEERIPLNAIAAGDSVTVPVEAVVFGEENQEGSVQVTLEYRMTGSNGTFSKKIDPFVYKISSSPLIINVSAIEKVSAGQSVEVELQLRSNATTPLRDILVSAVYPNNFDFTSAEPSPSHRTSEWVVSEIAPSETKTITITGIVVGQQDEEFQLQFRAGASQQDNQFALGPVLANATANFEIEQPFIDVGVVFNGLEQEVVTLRTGQIINGLVQIRNTLSDTLYDVVVEASISGNVLQRQEVSVNDGFFDSNDDVIRWDTSSNENLQQLSPGQTMNFTFTIKPNEQVQTPAFAVVANTFARRVSEPRATEQLIGTAEGEVKFTSVVAVARQADYVRGPIPPVADEETVYSITLAVDAGGNDITGAVVSTALPQYVNWKDVISGAGSLAFNPVSQELVWTVGDVSAGEQKIVTFEIGLEPSQNQVRTTPALLGTQRLRATDRFTNTVVRAENIPVSSELSRESGYSENNGRVVTEVVETDDESE